MAKNNEQAAEQIVEAQDTQLTNIEQAIEAKKAATAAILKQEGSKSQKIKDLYALGFKVGEIADMLGIRYNFAYNVLSNHCNMNGLVLETEKKDSVKDKIIELHLLGKTNKEISIELKTNYNYVFNTIKQYKANNPAPQATEIVPAEETE